MTAQEIRALKSLPDALVKDGVQIITFGQVVYAAHPDFLPHYLSEKKGQWVPIQFIDTAHDLPIPSR